MGIRVEGPFSKKSYSSLFFPPDLLCSLMFSSECECAWWYFLASPDIFILKKISGPAVALPAFLNNVNEARVKPSITYFRNMSPGQEKETGKLGISAGE